MASTVADAHGNPIMHTALTFQTGLSCRHLAARPVNLVRPKVHSTITVCRRHQHVLINRTEQLKNGSLTLGAQRLQGLFHSLSKVLFIFRSHYLFAIGLGAIFSLRRSTPPVCTALSNCATLEIPTIRIGANRRNGTIALHRVTFQRVYLAAIPS